MIRKIYAAVAAAALVGLTGCATKDAWMGATAETKYDIELEKIRQVAILNNDDYYEYHKDGKIYVLADAKDVKNFLSTEEFALRVTTIGGGPKGETLVFAIANPEKSKKEGFGAVEMYYGRRVGAEKDFYAEVLKGGTYYVFGDWKSLETYRKKGSFKSVSSGKTKQGKAAKFAANSEFVKTRFKDLHG